MGLKEEFVAQKSLAIVGVSRTRGFGNMVLKELRKKGYEVFPVNAKADTVEGEPCFKSLADLPKPVDGVITIVPPDQTEKVVEECAQAGIKRLWMQQGSESPVAIKLCEEKGIAAVHDACIMMYAQPTGFHAFHGFIWKLLGKR